MPAPEREPDPIDACRELLQSSGVDVRVIAHVCRTLRVRYGGSETYIRRRDRPAIDSVIRSGLERGEAPEAIARRAGVSTSTIRRRRRSWLA